jgi:hypothetical protein
VSRIGLAGHRDMIRNPSRIETGFRAPKSS